MFTNVNNASAILKMAEKAVGGNTCAGWQGWAAGAEIETTP